MSQGSSSHDSIGNRWPELAVAGVLLAIAALVITDSLRVGIDWADDGPRAGYFPFYVGLLLAAASAWVLVGQLLRWHADNPEFARREQIASVFKILVPTTVYTALIGVTGLYVASLLLIGYFMRRHGRYRWLPTAAVAVGVPLVVWAVFERWFLVLLPKGPLERALGF